MKALKKIIAAALAVAMVLTMLTACAVSTGDIRDALEENTDLEYYSTLDSDDAFKKVKAVNDGFKRNETKDTIEDDLAEAVEKNVSSNSARVILYAVDGSATDLAKDINKQVKALENKTGVTYKTFGCHIHNGYISKDNAVVVIISTEAKPES